LAGYSAGVLSNLAAFLFLLIENLSFLIKSLMKVNNQKYLIKLAVTAIERMTDVMLSPIR